MTKDRVKELIAQLEAILKEFSDFDDLPHYSQKYCPLIHNHYDLSQILFGIGYYRWECGFCGREEVE